MNEKRILKIKVEIFGIDLIIPHEYPIKRKHFSRVLS
jgi:hypothetical protein